MGEKFWEDAAARNAPSSEFNGVKCPQCGYVSFPNLLECRKCGYRFAQAQKTGTTQETGMASPGGKNPVDAAHSEAAQGGFSPVQENAALDTTISRPPGMNEIPNPAGGLNARLEIASQRAGLSERVASFRRRRDAEREKAGREMALQFDFDLETPEKVSASANSPPVVARSSGVGTRPALDRAFEERGVGETRSRLESVPLGERAGQDPLRPESFAESLREPSRSQPIEFMDASFTAPDRFEDVDDSGIITAPIRKRFLAGLIDAAVLLIAACLFAALFSLVGGYLQATPVDIVIAGWIVAFWIFTYFAAFSAMTLSTPGQALMGLTVRNLDGEPPTRQESLLRAFGYLVSIGSLMLGFLWAAMDSDGMSWHDHISGTLLAED